jgi:hypothetical protein
MRKILLSLVIFILTAGAYTAAQAQNTTLELTPGMYTIERVTSTNLKPEPIKRTEQKCIKESTYDPTTALPDKENCSVKNEKKTGNKITFDIDCKGGPQMLPMTGTAVISTTKSTLSWELNMKGMMEDQEVTVTSKGNGKRTGDCK